MRVLLTGARAPVTLDLARMLNRSGNQVFLADSLRFGCAAFSRKQSGMHLVPPAASNPRDFIGALNRIIRRRNIELLVPTCEEIFFISRFKNQIECDVFSDEFECLHRIHSKWLFAQFASNEHAAVPETRLIESQDELARYDADSTQWVFKPEYSRFASQTLIAPKSHQLGKIDAGPNRHWVAQRHISGEEVSTYSIADKGELIAHVSYRCSYRVGQASGIYFNRVNNNRIARFVRDFVAGQGFTGQIGFDIIVDADDVPWILEGNPRATSGAHLFLLGGTSLADCFTARCSNRQGELMEPETESPRMVGIAMLIWGLKQALLARKPFQFIKDLVRGDDVVWQWNDCLPCLGLPLTLGELLFLSLRKRKSLQAVSTFDIEWNGEPIE